MASASSTHAQTNWVGQFSSNWFLSGNWDAGFPRQTTDGNINTVTPNSVVVVSPGALARTLTIGVNGTGMLTIQADGTVAASSGIDSNLPGGLGTVTVTGAGSTWNNIIGLNIGNFGTGTHTIADGGIVSGPVVIAANASAIGTLNIGAGAGSPPAAPGTLTGMSVAFGAGTGTINFNHTSATYVFAPAISGNGTVNVLAGATTFTGANSYRGATNVIGGRLQAGVPNTFSPNSAVTVASGGTLDLNGFSQTISSDLNAGLVSLGMGTAPGTVLTMTSYTGAGGTIAMNSLLGRDGSRRTSLSSMAAARPAIRCAHHQCGRLWCLDAGGWHHGGAGDQRRHDGAQCLRACWRGTRRCILL